MFIVHFPFTVVGLLLIVFAVGGDSGLIQVIASGSGSDDEEDPTTTTNPKPTLSPTYLGYISVFPFVGTLVGFLLGQLVSDPSAKWAARRNNGVFEPEFRMFWTRMMI